MPAAPHSFTGGHQRCFCLNFPLKLRGAAGEQGDVHTCSPARSFGPPGNELRGWWAPDVHAYPWSTTPPSHLAKVRLRSFRGVIGGLSAEFGIWHILLTCAPFAGGLSNALVVFTRRGPTPGAHSLKIWRSCARSFWGSPLACLFSRGTGTRGVAAISGAKSATTPAPELRGHCIPAPPRGIDMPSSVPRWGTCPPPPPTTARPLH